MKDVSLPVAYASQANSAHWKPDKATWAEVCEWVLHPADSKRCGNYIFATLKKTVKVHAGDADPCKGVHRDSRSVTRRSAVLVLDIDEPDADFELTIALELAGVAFLWHTTYSSTPSEPRYRLIVLVDRDMAPDEYIAATRALAERIGLEQFDKGSFEATRYMFKPSARKKSWYAYHINDGEPLSVDTLLEEFDTDLSSHEIPEPNRTKRDPFTLDDPIGAFNRVYDDWDLLIRTYDLPYERVGDGRYQLKGAVSEAGMGLVPGTTNLVYSHHASDPAYGRACSAFDLVRLHWFKDLDENVKPDTPINRLPSNIEMCTVASRDKRVIEEIFSTIAEDFEKDVSDGDSDDVNNPDDVGWKTRISLTNTGRFRESVQNYDLLRKHDPVFRSLYFNIMTMMPELNQDVPWRRVSSMTRAWDDVDTAELRFYLEREYRVKITKELAESLVIAEAGQHRKHPVQDYLRELEWDGTPRVETSLPGAEDTPYNRLVARKVLVGAVARAMEPGVKWDHTLILYGPQGVGKSTWMERMAMVGSPERRSYLYSLGDIRSKDTLMAMNMSWIVTSDEGHTLRKSDNDTLKEFLTRNSDVYRVPYGRATRLHPRQCVIWSTTNDETILRRQEGNRRFLIVRCMRKLDLDTMTPEYVDQLWAEAYALYAAGERLFLTEEEFRQAEKQQQPFLEEDTTAGILQEFLDQLVPLDWWDRSPEERLQWLEDRRSGFEPEGEIQVDRTCTRQLWAEALGQHIPPRRGDLLEIAASLREIGWDTGYGTGKSQGHRRFKGYGPQTSFYRPSGKDLI